MEHTKPWKIVKEDRAGNVTMLCVYDVDGRYVFSRPHGMHIKSVHHIVRCVNAHDALVEAASDALQMLIDLGGALQTLIDLGADGDIASMPHPVCEKLRAALALAGEEE
jgi:hypothetical protein